MKIKELSQRMTRKSAGVKKREILVPKHSHVCVLSLTHTDTHAHTHSVDDALRSISYVTIH